MTRKSSILLPAGIRTAPVVLSSLIGLSMCAISAIIIFITDFNSAINRISVFDDAGKRIFLENEKMEAYNGSASFEFFRIYFVCLAFLALYFFVYHFLGSKSIYTMRRLRNPLELYVRCLSIPVIFTLVSIALIYLMNFAFIKFYLYYVPEENLFSMWDEYLWEVLR